MIDPRPEDMRWPGFRAKLLPAYAVRAAGWSWPRVYFRDWYTGRWWALCVGPWMFFGGEGIFD